MPSEIERKYLVSTVPFRLAEHPATALEQGYLAVSEHVEVRLRRAAEELTLTVKVGHGEIREEVEITLEPVQFERLWPLTEGARLAKTRHVVPLGDGLRAEVDTYNGQLEGLRVAEVEFRSAEQCRGFQPPSWFGPELTGEERYSNRSLALEGLPDEGREHDPASSGKKEGMSAYRLERTESPAEGLRRIARGRARKARGRLARARRGEDTAEAIHGARKDLKKIRAVVRLVRRDLGKKAYRAENRRYRDAGRLLSESRDAEVKLATLRTLRERFGEALPADSADAWEAALEADRARIASAGAAATEERMQRAVAAIAEAERGIGEWRLEHDSWALLEPGLAQSYSRGRQALEAVRRGNRAEDVHELRKRVKDLWYQLRLLGDAWPEMLEPSAEQAHRLADLLGDHHDLTVLGEDLRSRPGLDSGRAAGEELIARRQTELLEDAGALGDRIYAEKPRCFRRRMRSYWRSWRDESGG